MTHDERHSERLFTDQRNQRPSRSRGNCGKGSLKFCLTKLTEVRKEERVNMITQYEIEKLIRTIIEIEQPDQIVLFGSYAYGEPKEDSDLDILVVKDYHLPRHKRGQQLLKSLSYVRFPLDILFYTPAEIVKWQDASLAFITTVISKGKVLYGQQQPTNTQLVRED